LLILDRQTYSYTQVIIRSHKLKDPQYSGQKDKQWLKDPQYSGQKDKQWLKDPQYSGQKDKQWLKDPQYSGQPKTEDCGTPLKQY
jgi:hypothetical protein